MKKPKLIPFKQQDKFGFSDTDKNIILPCNYDFVRPFSEGLAAVLINRKGISKYGFIDEQGQLVIPPQFDNVLDFENNFSEIIIRGLVGLIDRKGKLIIPPIYHSVDVSDSFIICSDGDDHYASAPSDPRHFLFNSDLAEEYVGYKKVNCGCYYYYDLMGNLIDISVPEEDGAFLSNKRISEVIKFSNERERKGNADFRISKMIHEKFKLDKYEKGGVDERDIETGERISEAFEKDNLWPIRFKNKWGYIDKNFDIKIEPCYDKAKVFSCGLAAVCFNDWWGYIDRNGKIKFPLQFTNASSFIDDISIVSSDYGDTYFRSNGKLLNIWQQGLEREFGEYATVFDQDVFDGRVEGEGFSIVDKQLNIINKQLYNHIFEIIGDLFLVVKDRKLFYVDNRGEEYYSHSYLSKYKQMQGSELDDLPF